MCGCVARSFKCISGRVWRLAWRRRPEHHRQRAGLSSRARSIVCHAASDIGRTGDADDCRPVARRGGEGLSRLDRDRCPRGPLSRPFRWSRQGRWSRWNGWAGWWSPGGTGRPRRLPDPTATIVFARGGETRERLFNPYTGADLGDSTTRGQWFLLWVTRLHDDLLLERPDGPGGMGCSV